MSGPLWNVEPTDDEKDYDGNYLEPDEQKALDEFVDELTDDEDW